MNFRSRHRVCLLALVAGVCAFPPEGEAADFELLAQDTYLSPSMLNPGMPVKGKPQSTFVASSLIAGVESAYQYRNEFSDDASYTATAAISWYVRRWQLEATYTGRSLLENDPAQSPSAVPINRFKTAIAYYFPAKTNVASHQYDVDDFRLMTGWIRDRRRNGDQVDEFFIESSLKLVPRSMAVHLKLLPEASGAYYYAWKPRQREHFLGYEGRFLARRFKNGTTLRLMGSLGGTSQGGDWKFGALQSGFVLSVPRLLPRTTFDVGFSLARDLHRDEWNYQLAVVAVGDAISKFIR